MKRFLYLLLLITPLLCSLELDAKSKVISYRGKFDSRFLIVIDKDSFDAAKQEVLEYKNILEHQGLGVQILIGQWNDPLVLRKEIRKLFYKRTTLEGAVFIGDIPVVRIRNFQHATTAFKMDEERFPMTESSVTSDRFYDDLDLDFEFIKVDDDNPRHFYYNIKESSPQWINSNFYSARMLPPSDMGVSEHELLRKYLKKVVEAHREINYADKLIFFNGHAYNSDCLTAWQNQQFAIKEQFPEAFKRGDGNAFYNFRQDPFMKFRLFTEMQKPEVDLFVYHEHGAFDTQYINGEYPAPNVLGFYSPSAVGPVEALSISLRNGYRRNRGERAETFKQRVIKDYALSESFFADSIMAVTRVADSLFSANINIVLSDLKKIKPQARVAIFDACYNGSFHKPGYVAGYHVFGDGNTIVAQGNTVNVLQDKWSMELIGMLAEGVRIGFWQKETQTLESHLIGDPTFRFTAGSPSQLRHFEAIALNKNLALNSKETKVWMHYLQSDNPNYQSIALKQLAKNPPDSYEELLVQYFNESPYYSVRMQALKRLIDVGGEPLVQTLAKALYDPYELIRRNAARFAGYSGDSRLLSPLVNNVLFSRESHRLQYACQIALTMFNADSIAAELERQNKGSHLFSGDSAVTEISAYFHSQDKRQQNSLKTIMDKNAEQQDRIMAVRFLRNYNNHSQVDDLLVLLADNSDDTKVRVVLAEALGWFNWSIEREKIVDALNALYLNELVPDEVKLEVLQSMRRLNP